MNIRNTYLAGDLMHCDVSIRRAKFKLGDCVCYRRQELKTVGIITDIIGIKYSFHRVTYFVVSWTPEREPTYDYF